MLILNIVMPSHVHVIQLCLVLGTMLFDTCHVVAGIYNLCACTRLGTHQGGVYLALQISFGTFGSNMIWRTYLREMSAGSYPGCSSQLWSEHVCLTIEFLTCYPALERGYRPCSLLQLVLSTVSNLQTIFLPFSVPSSRLVSFSVSQSQLSLSTI